METVGSRKAVRFGCALAAVVAGLATACTGPQPGVPEPEDVVCRPVGKLAIHVRPGVDLKCPEARWPVVHALACDQASVCGEPLRVPEGSVLTYTQGYCALATPPSTGALATPPSTLRLGATNCETRRICVSVQAPDLARAVLHEVGHLLDGCHG